MSIATNTSTLEWGFSLKNTTDIFDSDGRFNCWTPEWISIWWGDSTCSWVIVMWEITCSCGIEKVQLLLIPQIPIQGRVYFVIGISWGGPKVFDIHCFQETKQHKCSGNRMKRAQRCHLLGTPVMRYHFSCTVSECGLHFLGLSFTCWMRLMILAIGKAWPQNGYPKKEEIWICRTRWRNLAIWQKDQKFIGPKMRCGDCFVRQEKWVLARHYREWVSWNKSHICR